MKRFPIFRPGRHTAASGATLDFSEDQLRQAVAAYDPALHEAPIVVGHPRDNHPAFGWVGSLSFNEETGEIEVDPKQVDADFAELVAAGRYKKRSASWYLPDAPNNPKPGTLYLRHVGFLGAQPPALKGLRDVSFSDAEEGVVEFGDRERWAFSSLASVMRGLREMLIGDKGVEAADKVMPNYLIASLEDAAKEHEPQPAAVSPAFNEEDPMNIEELKAQVAALTAERDALKSQVASFSEREARVAEAEKKIARSAIEARVDAAIKAGRLLASQKKHAIDFAASLADGELVIDFGEGDKAEKLSQREAYLRQIEQAAPVVDFRELGGNANPASGQTEPSIADLEANLMSQVASGGQAK